MIEMKFFRGIELPTPLEINSIYLIRNLDSGKLEITATGSNGVGIPMLTQADVLQLIADNGGSTEAHAISMTGDGTWTVNFDGASDATAAMTLSNTGVVAGEYSVVTVDAKGRVTGSRALTAGDIPSELTSNTSGNAATATLATAASKLAATFLLNGVPVDGSGPITINAEDSTARVAVSEKGVALGVATLDDAGLVPASQLPSFVDDVIEVEAFDELPGRPDDPGTNGPASKGKIYVVVTGEDTSIYRWSGTTYIAIGTGTGVADSAIKLATARGIAITGDATWTVNFDGSQDASAALTLADTGIVAGVYAGITFDTKGRAIAARALIEDDMPMMTYLKVESSQSVMVEGNWDE